MELRVAPFVALVAAIVFDGTAIVLLIQQEWLIGACFLVPVFFCLIYIVIEYIRRPDIDLLPIEYYEYVDEPEEAHDLS